MMETALPLSRASCKRPMTIHASEEKPIPAVMRRRAVASRPKRFSIGYSTRLLNGISSITSIGFSACICAGRNQLGFSMVFACTIHVEAFWSNSEKNGVTRAKMTRIRSTARTPSTASSGWMPRARSSCMAVPMLPKASSNTSAVHAEITKPHSGML